MPKAVCGSCFTVQKLHHLSPMANTLLGVLWDTLFVRYCSLEVNHCKGVDIKLHPSPMQKSIKW